jgi:hypothetical protein
LADVAEIVTGNTPPKKDGDNRVPCRQAGQLSRFSRAVESEIYLVIGFPEIGAFVAEIDYRAMTLTIAPRGR